MALEIYWTQRAKEGLESVIDYLEEHWTKKEILNLESNLKNLLENILEYPEICPKTSKQKSVYKGLVDKNNYLVYKYKPRKKVIEIINFRGTKQKPLV